jgi:hypothetical protein
VVPPSPPAILQIYREPLEPGAEAEYDRIESDTARKCVQFQCPHAYLALESVTGPREVWWLNGYDSLEDKKQVAEAWAKNERLLAVLAANAKRKAALIGKPTETVARYRPDLSRPPNWVLGRGRFLVVTSTRATRETDPVTGAVFEADDGTRLVIVSARTREEADTAAAAAGLGARVFAVRPSWSHPDQAWIAADSAFWRR